MNGGSRVAEILKAQGVEFLFTLCGGHISPILVESKKRGIRVIDMRHEVNTVFAADAVSRLTGVPGVAAVTAGPGVANTITAIKNAQLAQSPLVLIGGATATMLRGRGALQDIDQTSLIAPHVKWHGKANTLREVGPLLEEAFERCQSGVPGPVFVELAVDLLYDPSVVREWYAAKTDKPDKTPMEHALALYIKGHLTYLFLGADDGPASPRRAPIPAEPSHSDLKAAIRKFDGAERPVLVLGSQTMLHPRRAEELRRAIERIGAPVYLSGMARGLLGAGHPLQMMHKRRDALKGSDLVVLCGVPCDFRLDYGSHLSRTEVISVNLSDEDLKKNRRPEVGVLADPHSFLVSLARELPGTPMYEPWIEKLRANDHKREAEIESMAGEETAHMNPLRVCRGLDAHLTDDSVLVGDGGDFVATAAYTLRPRRPYGWLDPGVFGTLGVGAGFAIGAKLVNPSSDVWLLWGDGAAGFSLMELDTCARHGIAINALIGNDAGWTQIMRDQVPILGDAVGCELGYTAYEKVAEGLGAAGLLADDESKLDEIYTRALELSRGGKPVVVNALLGRSDFRKGSISI